MAFEVNVSTPPPPGTLVVQVTLGASYGPMQATVTVTNRVSRETVANPNPDTSVPGQLTYTYSGLAAGIYDIHVTCGLESIDTSATIGPGLTFMAKMASTNPAPQPAVRKA